MSRRFKKSCSQKTKQNLNIILLLVYSLLSVFLLFLIFKYNILAFRHINIVVAVFTLMVAVTATLLIIYKKAEKFTIFFLTLAVLVSSVSVFALQQFVGFTSHINATSNYSEYSLSVVVLKDSDINMLPNYLVLWDQQVRIMRIFKS